VFEEVVTQGESIAVPVKGVEGSRSAIGDFREKNVFDYRKSQNLVLRNGFLNASTQKVHRPRSQSPQNFNIENV